MNNKWCEGKHSPPTINKVYTEENPLRLLNLEEFSNSCCLIRHNIAHLGNVADLGTWSGVLDADWLHILIYLRNKGMECSDFWNT